MPDDGDGPQIVSFDAPAGATVEFTNGTDRAQAWRFNYGPLGVVECTLPPGGVIRFTPASQLPVITLDDADLDVSDFDNVTRLDKPD